MSIAVFGENIVDLIQQDDGQFTAHLGGSPYNVAIGLARQGIPTSYLAPRSSDQFGDQFEKMLTANNVRLPQVKRSPLPSSVALITLSSEGHAQYRLYRSDIADKDIDAASIMENISDDTLIFHTGSLAITPDFLPVIKSIIDHCHSQQILVSIDINIREHVSPHQAEYLEGVRSLLPLADIVKASDEDLDAFAQKESSNQLARQFYEEMDGGLFLFTQGADGAQIFTDKGVTSARTAANDPIVDTIGAGDTFHAAFLSRFHKLKQQSIDLTIDHYSYALNYAVTAAAINVSRQGCQPPTVEETMASMVRS